MRRLLHLTHRHRSPATNQALGLLLAFNAGAVNAGGFLVLQRYTSHMTGFASQLADGAVLGQTTLVLNALGAILAFLAGAAVCALLVHWARQQHLRCVYALPLLLEAALLFPFGLMGAITLGWHTPFAVPLTVLLLSFIMGLQNAVGSKTSGGRIRTTHMTGNITDLGMELGKMLYWNRQAARHGAVPDATAVGVHHNRQRAAMAAGLLGSFVLGGFVGALGFQRVGFICVVPLAALLFALSVMPMRRDWARWRAIVWGGS
ncbi:YoaK family protein [Roseateles amylovorans]|uniref:DUF1275 domain-containing protein n=1 Tax=Roseateles amylovorans TaxID=2978473 RepID=A0ABY6AXV6_9BURK|nr:YoaK family protein [Roseateles amylovorans]UXH77507.1 DUF1275 domain-containing protein [Roseateles amylovorans]